MFQRIKTFCSDLFTREHLIVAMKIGGGILGGGLIFAGALMPFYGVAGGLLIAAECIAVLGGILGGVTVFGMIVGLKATKKE